MGCREGFMYFCMCGVAVRVIHLLAFLCLARWWLCMLEQKIPGLRCFESTLEYAVPRPSLGWGAPAYPLGYCGALWDSSFYLWSVMWHLGNGCFTR